jgi:teichuronic acid biosynthesis glycosyltransferase TuaH
VSPGRLHRVCEPWDSLDVSCERTSVALRVEASLEYAAMEQDSVSSSRKDVVFTFTSEMLEDAIGREFCRPADQVVLALARDSRVGQLVVADAWRSYVLSLLRGRNIHRAERISLAGREVMRARPLRLKREDPLSLAAVERSYSHYSELLGRVLGSARGERKAQPKSAALVTCSPLVAAFSDARWIDNVVYFGRDDWATDERLAKWRDVYEYAYKKIERKGVRCFAVSEELARRISPDATVVPNGAIAEVWRPDHPTPSRIAALPGPRAIYTGTIGNRFSAELVKATAKIVGSLVLIGYTCDADTMEWLNMLGNVHVFGPVGQRELAATVQACDVGVIPHRDTDFIRAMSPLKLYEYLAAGLPVVSVDLPPVHGVDDERVHICGAADWAEGLKAAIASGRASNSRRQEFIDNVAWERRLRVLVDAAVR